MSNQLRTINYPFPSFNSKRCDYEQLECKILQKNHRFNSKRCDYELDYCFHTFFLFVVSIPKGAIMRISAIAFELSTSAVSIPKGAIMSSFY